MTFPGRVAIDLARCTGGSPSGRLGQNHAGRKAITGAGGVNIAGCQVRSAGGTGRQYAWPFLNSFVGVLPTIGGAVVSIVRPLLFLFQRESAMDPSLNPFTDMCGRAFDELQFQAANRSRVTSNPFWNLRRFCFLTELGAPWGKGLRW